MTDLLSPAEPKPEKTYFSTEDIRSALRKKYDPEEWCLMFEVAPETGGGTRYADAVAMNFWRSRGHVLLGFEIKVSRGDWLRELKNPAKAEPVLQYCDQWFVVTPKDIVKPGELPEGWGHLVVTGRGIQVATVAKKLEPKPVTRAFFASIMRRGHEDLNVRASAMIESERKRLDDAFDRRVAERVKTETREIKRVLEAVKEFEQKTGLKLSEWNIPVGTVKLAVALQKMEGYSDEPLHRLFDLSRQLELVAIDLRAARAAIYPEAANDQSRAA